MDIIVCFVIYKLVFQRFAKTLGIKTTSELMQAAKTKVCKAIDSMEPEYCYIAYVASRVLQVIGAVAMVISLFVKGGLLDHVLGIAIGIMFIVGMNKVCNRIVNRF